MPVYVYHCDNCGTQFEKNQRFSDEPLKIALNVGRKHCTKSSPLRLVLFTRVPAFIQPTIAPVPAACLPPAAQKKAAAKRPSLLEPAKESTNHLQKKIRHSLL
jgi:putative FmdB family regulatory protein